MCAATRSEVTVVKLDPTGAVAARYRGTLLPGRPGWIVIEAEWQLGTVVAGPICFEPGDRLIEYFSVVEPVNAFALYARGGPFKGWYANVACPARFIDGVLYWQDLYIDVVVDATGNLSVLDEEELAASDVPRTDPDAYACIVAARDRLLAALRSGSYPFDQHPSIRLLPVPAEKVQ